MLGDLCSARLGQHGHAHPQVRRIRSLLNIYWVSFDTASKPLSLLTLGLKGYMHTYKHAHAYVCTFILVSPIVKGLI